MERGGGRSLPWTTGLSGPVLPSGFLAHWSPVQGRSMQGAFSARGEVTVGSV